MWCEQQAAALAREGRLAFPVGAGALEPQHGVGLCSREGLPPAEQ